MKIQKQFNFSFTIDGLPYNFSMVAEDEESAKRQLVEVLKKLIDELTKPA